MISLTEVASLLGQQSPIAAKIRDIHLLITLFIPFHCFFHDAALEFPKAFDGQLKKETL